ncbi:cytochrome c nitrite reductase small subunit [Halodesulfovibrio aestuarii]|uniref:Cytochrome c nitrite reductase small subunit n=1 Tax=Halodesulfovibrio aestuarii TaxID=126333 RepID=A0ABV4JZN5_9BACT
MTIAVCFVLYIVYSSMAFTYLSGDSKYCINCHAMNTQYSTWKKGSHALVAECVDCHLPQDNIIKKYIVKSEIGAHDVIAFTKNDYKNSITITSESASRVQNNCIRCHGKTVERLMFNSMDQHKDDAVTTGRRCWSCHNQIAHGKVRGLTTMPNDLTVKEGN